MRCERGPSRCHVDSRSRAADIVRSSLSITVLVVLVGCVSTAGSVDGDGGGGCTGTMGNVIGTGGGTDTGGGNTPLGDRGEPITIDVSDTEQFVPGSPATHPIAGRVHGGNGTFAFTINDEIVPLGEDGRFSTEIDVAPGLQVVKLAARDTATPPGKRDVNLSLLVSEFLPEGEINPAAAALVLTSEMVSSMADPMQDLVASLDVASEIRSRAVLSEDSTCTTHPRSATHGRPTLRLFVTETGALTMEVLIPNLSIDFYGTCSMLISTVNITGRIETNVAILSELSAAPSDDCIQGLDHTPATVDLRDFDLQISGGSGLLESLIVMLMGEMKEGETAEELKTQFATEAEELLGPQLEDITVFDSTTPMELLAVPMDASLCLTGLSSEGGVPLARVGARVVGPGGGVGPGAPLVEGELPPAAPHTFWLDANLVAQFLYSAWIARGLQSDAISEIPISMIALLEPDLEDLFPEDATVSVAMDGQLPPRVRAAEPGSEGDLVVEIPDLQLRLSVDGEPLYTLSSNLELTLDLAPAEAGLAPMVTAVHTTTCLLEEPVVDIADAALAASVDMQIATVATDLLGGAVISLPDVGGGLRPVDAVPAPGGRYVQVTLE
jgi:hypothetical protein